MLSRGLRRLRQSAKGPGQSRRNVTDWRKPVGAIVSGKTVSALKHFERIAGNVNYQYGGCYNIVHHMRMERNIDSNIVRKAAMDLLQHHPYLSKDVVFTPTLGGIIMSNENPGIMVTTESKVDNDVRKILEDEMNTPMLEGSWRVRVLQATDSIATTDIIVTVNHSICDHWGVAQLVAELLDRYIDYDERKHEKTPPPSLITLKPPPDIYPKGGLRLYWQVIQHQWDVARTDSGLKPLSVPKSIFPNNPLRATLADVKSCAKVVEFEDPAIHPMAVRAVLLEAIKESIFNLAPEASAALRLAQPYDLRKFTTFTEEQSNIRNYVAPLNHAFEIPDSSANSLSSLALKINSTIEKTSTSRLLLNKRLADFAATYAHNGGMFTVAPQPVAMFRTVPSISPPRDLVDYFRIVSSSMCVTSKLPMFEVVFGSEIRKSKLVLSWANAGPFTEEAVEKCAARLQELTPAVSNAIKARTRSSDV